MDAVHTFVVTLTRIVQTLRMSHYIKLRKVP